MMKSRRQILLTQKADLLEQLRAENAKSPEADAMRMGGLALDAADLFLNVLIDIAHPVSSEPLESAVPSTVSEMAAGFVDLQKQQGQI